MIEKWMLDTNVCIHLLNQRHAHQTILQRMHGLRYGQNVISAITHAELQSGMSRRQNQVDHLAGLNLFLERFLIAPFDHHAAQVYGPLRLSLQATRQTIGPLDMLIAAHALSLDAAW